MRIPFLSAFLLVAAIGLGCSESTTVSEPEATPASATRTPTTAPPTASPTNTPEPTPVDVTAEIVVLRLRVSGLPIGEMVVYTASTDPNELLGRPGGYLSKVNFRDTRLGDSSPEFDISEGGSVEVFEDEAGAQRRKEYIDTVSQGFAPLIEYSFVKGPVLLRLSKSLLPEQAGEYEDRLTELLP